MKKIASMIIATAMLIHGNASAKNALDLLNKDTRNAISCFAANMFNTADFTQGEMELYFEDKRLKKVFKTFNVNDGFNGHAEDANYYYAGYPKKNIYVMGMPVKKVIASWNGMHEFASVKLTIPYSYDKVKAVIEKKTQLKAKKTKDLNAYKGTFYGVAKVVKHKTMSGELPFFHKIAIKKLSNNQTEIDCDISAFGN